MNSQGILQPVGVLALVNGRVILPNEVVTDRAVIVEGNKILEIPATGSLGAGMTKIDVEGRYIAPGLIDIHTHGALGRSFLETDTGAYGAITREQATRGVTAILPTISAAPVDQMMRCTEFSRAWMHSIHPGAQVLGVHLEGPYFSAEQRGAQDPHYLRTPDDGSADLLLAAHDAVRIMSFAPELPGALTLTAQLAGLGIVPAAGHSAANDEQVRIAMQAGLRHVIHLWSGQSTTIRQGPWRKPGLLEASLTFDGLTAEMIADNRHLPPTLMGLAYKCLGPDRLCVISDATQGTGLPEGTRVARSGGDGVAFDVQNGVAMTLDRTSFAGSTTLLNQMVPIVINVVGIPLAKAVRMASLTPATVRGLASRKGSLAASKAADLAIFDGDFTAWRTMIMGRWECAKGRN